MCSTWRRGPRGLALAAITLTLSACSQAAHSDFGAGQRHTIAGETMGTTFAVTVVSDARVGGPQVSAAAASPAREFEPATVEAEVRRLLERIEGRMSHYRPASEVSRFNAARTTEPRPMSRETLGVVAEALAVSRVSRGAFDVTVGSARGCLGLRAGRARAGRRRTTRPWTAIRATRSGPDLLEVDLGGGDAPEAAEGTSSSICRPSRRAMRSTRSRPCWKRAASATTWSRSAASCAAAGANERGSAVAGRHRTTGSGRTVGAAHRAPDGCRGRHVRRLPQLLRPGRRSGCRTPSIRAPAVRSRTRCGR